MTDKRCKNGHFIDESWDLCPYCPPENAYVGERSSRESAPPQPSRPSPPSSPPRSSPSNERAESPEPNEGPQRTVTYSRAQSEGHRFVVGWLIGLNGPSRGESFVVRSGRNTLGRSRNSEIVIIDDQASSHHADLVYRPEEQRYILMDSNSTNGTYVNGKEIEPRRDLASRDVITIGAQRFLFIALTELGLNWDDKGELT